MATPLLTATLGDEVSNEQWDGKPLALNEIPMTLSELVESVETIIGLSAVDVLGAAYAELGGRGDGLIVLHAEGGACTIASEAVQV